MLATTKKFTQLSPPAKNGIVIMGARIGRAIKRRETYSAFAQRVGISRPTLRRLVNGESGVDWAIVVACLDALGFLGQLNDIADPKNDPLSYLDGQTKTTRINNNF